MIYPKEILDFAKNEENFRLYLEATRILRAIGYTEILRVVGRPVIPTGGQNPYEMATEGARAAGYNQALDYLLGLTEPETVNRIQPVESVVPNFGALNSLVASGDLTQEEADARRNNKPLPTPVVTHANAATKVDADE